MTKRRLNVDLDELVVALETSFHEIHHYLDLETGRIIMITDETDWQLEEIYDEILDQDGNPTMPLAEHLQMRDDLQDWFKEALIEADLVAQWHGSRFIAVEPEGPHEDYRDMERFIRTVADPDLQDRLWRAIRGRGAFRRFKDLVARHPDVEEQWYAY